MRALLVIASLWIAACSAPSPAVSSPCVPCQQAAPAATTHSAEPRPAKLDALAQQRVELARKRVQLLRAEYAHGSRPLSEVLAAYREIAFAARDSGLRGEALRRPLQEYRDSLDQQRELTKLRLAKGAATDADMVQLDYAIAESDYWLAEAN